MLSSGVGRGGDTIPVVPTSFGHGMGLLAQTRPALRRNQALHHGTQQCMLEAIMIEMDNALAHRWQAQLALLGQAPVQQLQAAATS